MATDLNLSEDSQKLLAAHALTDIAHLAETPTARLVRCGKQDGSSVVLKEFTNIGWRDERAGLSFLAWRNGVGCGRLLDIEGRSALLEDCGSPLLGETVDPSILCKADAVCVEVLKDLHTQSDRQPPTQLTPLRQRLSSLLSGSDFRLIPADLLAAGRNGADIIFDECETVTPLHGDFHHGNVLFDKTTYRAIDPKGLIGPSVYDCANLFANPHTHPDLSRQIERIERLIDRLHAVFGWSHRCIFAAALGHQIQSLMWFVEDIGCLPASEDFLLAKLLQSKLAQYS